MRTAAANPAAEFLRLLPTHLKRCAVEKVSSAPTNRPQRLPSRGIDHTTSLGSPLRDQILERLDCDLEGNSLRTQKPAWEQSWAMAHEMIGRIGGEFLLVHIVASWLERRSPTTRVTYCHQAMTALSDLRVRKVDDLVNLPQEAALTWLRERARGVVRHGRPRRPRTINLAASVLNSLMAYIVSLDLVNRRWVPLPLAPINRGRHLDEEPVVLSPQQLADFWKLAMKRPRRQFLALILASLHGGRVAEVANIQWRDLRYQRRGERSAPAVMNVIGKGGKHRVVQIHPAVRGYLKRERRGKDPDAYVLADANGRPPTPQQVSYWAKKVFKALDLPGGYAHALRATWATMALENKSNSPLQVQKSGGWTNSTTMNEKYFKRRQVPLVRLFDERG